MTASALTDYDIVFALHTGVTIMMQQQAAFDDSGDMDVPFKMSDTGKGEIHLIPPGHVPLVLQNVPANMMTEIHERGFFMIYELDGEDISRCTPCVLVR